MTVASTTNQILFTNVQRVRRRKRNTHSSCARVGQKPTSSSKSRLRPSQLTMQRSSMAGRTVMPGIVESHAHLSLAAASVPELLHRLPSYATILSVLQAELMLMNGVTTARDLGGESLDSSAQSTVDRSGPLYPSGALISQTNGHADYRFLTRPTRDCAGPFPPPTSNTTACWLMEYRGCLCCGTRTTAAQGYPDQVCIGGGRAN